MSTKLKTKQAVHLPVEIAVEGTAPVSRINAEFAPAIAKGIYNAERQALTLGEKIGVGGEGTVYNIEGQAEFVAKIYHEIPSAEKAAKLIALVQRGTERLFKMSAWPVDVLRDRPDGNVIGFVMKKIGQAEEVHALHSPKSRLKKFPEASWAFLVHVATNIARALATMHEHGFIVGDVNPKNILVTRQATVFLLDCDSFQFSSDGKTYRCEGGFPEYTPPELQGLSFSEINRTQEHDCFGLAVVIFQLLFLGRHPYSGRYAGAGEMPLAKAIQEGRFAYGADAAQRSMHPPPGTLAFEALPMAITSLLRRAFLERDRPNPHEWIAPLEQCSKSLRGCKLHNGHYYFAELPTCPWCELEGQAGIRLFNFQFTARQAQSGQFPLDKILAELDRLEQIKQLPTASPSASILLSPAASQYAQARDVRFWLALACAVLGGAFIGWLAALPVAFWFLLVTGRIAYLLAKANPEIPLTLTSLFRKGSSAPKESLAAKIQASKQQAEIQLKRLEFQLWGTPEGDKSYFDRLNEIKERLKDYEALPRRREERLQTIEVELQKKALAKYLKQHSFDEPQLAGITPEMKSWLRERGINTAADLTSHRFRPTGNITQFQQLLDWRQQLVKDFQRTVPRGLPPETRLTVEREIDQQRGRLEADVSNALAFLRTLKPSLEEKQAHLLKPWVEAQREAAQAAIDLAVIAKQNRALPAIGALLVAFLLASAFASISPTLEHTLGNLHAMRTTDDTFNTYFNEGLRLVSNENYTEAKEVFKAALPYVSLTSWDDRYASFYHNYCYTKWKLKEAPTYLKFLENQLTTEPERNDYRVQMLMLYTFEHQKVNAVLEYRALKEKNLSIAESVQTEMKLHGVDLEADLRKQQ